MNEYHSEFQSLDHNHGQKIKIIDIKKFRILTFYRALSKPTRKNQIWIIFITLNAENELFKGRADSAQRDEQIRILAEINEQRAGRSDNPPSYGDLFPAEQPNI